MYVDMYVLVEEVFVIEVMHAIKFLRILLYHLPAM